ncbi:MAG TPA: site-specific DNA-methyltransferase [Planctomycetes bacterium]|nr:site-specific DNA-methyltransferase [Planctomycetota bacterium]
MLDAVNGLNRSYEGVWAKRMSVDAGLNRSLVSFQANKKRAVYRWFKYKEAFSAELVEYLLKKHRIKSGVMLDPFAGIGTALFAAGALGLQAKGIELLPVGQTAINTRRIIEWELEQADLDRLTYWRDTEPWKHTDAAKAVNELRITRGAYPDETLQWMRRYLAALEQENERTAAVLLFALLCVLESISYTRKDGQYLRWDYRSGRRQGKKKFDKGRILSFDEAIGNKLRTIEDDIRGYKRHGDLFPVPGSRAHVLLHAGSCLDALPKLKPKSYDCLITSPPYCNRYDYTRTYALELALLGIDEMGLTNLRQKMLSCTVENREKDLLAINPKWTKAIKVLV